ncbi:PH domain-containing protein [Streptomyces sp. MC1]|nr:PH domain-containing protein [Streptomyces sp. MC1]
MSALAVLGRRLDAGPDGLRFRTVLRWRRLEWDEIVGFEDVRQQRSPPPQHQSPCRGQARCRTSAPPRCAPSRSGWPSRAPCGAATRATPRRGGQGRSASPRSSSSPGAPRRSGSH